MAIGKNRFEAAYFHQKESGVLENDAGTQKKYGGSVKTGASARTYDRKEKNVVDKV